MLSFVGIFLCSYHMTQAKYPSQVSRVRGMGTFCAFDAASPEKAAQIVTSAKKGGTVRHMLGICKTSLEVRFKWLNVLHFLWKF